MRFYKWQRILGSLRWVTLLLTIVYAFTAGLSLPYYRAWVEYDTRDLRGQFFYIFFKDDVPFLLFTFFLLLLLVYLVYLQFRNFSWEKQVQKEHLSTIVESSPVTIITFDMTGTIITWNPCAEATIGIKYYDAIGENYAALLGIPSEEFAGYISRVELNLPLPDYTVTYAREDGARIILNGSITPLHDQKAGVTTGMLVVLADITDRYAVEVELQQYERRYVDLMESIDSIFLKLDCKGNVIFWNRYAAEFFGYSAEELKGKPALETILPGVATDESRNETIIKRLCAYPTRNMEVNINENMTKDGRKVWVSWSSYSRMNPMGEMEIICVGNDFTGIREAELHQIAMLKRSEALITAADALLNCKSLDEVTARSVELARVHLGLERCSIALVHENMLQMKYGTDMNGQTTNERGNGHLLTSKYRNELMEIHSSAAHYRLEERGYRESVDNSYIELGTGQIAITPLVASSGLVGVFYNDDAISGRPLVAEMQEVVVLYCSILANLIERIRTDEELQQERFLLQTLLDNIPDHIFFKDVNSRFTRISKGLADHFDVSQADAIGHTEFDYFSDIYAQKSYDDERQVMDTSIPVLGLEEMQTWPDGEVSWVNSTKLPLLGPDGAVQGTFGISRDITEKKNAENSQRTLLEGLRAVLDIADELLSCATVDELLRLAVEMACQRLGLERAAIMLEDGQGNLRGTYAIDMDGTTIDIHDQYISIEEHLVRTRRMKSIHNRWFTAEDENSNNTNNLFGISAVTPFKMGERIGIFNNDNALSGGMLNPDMQDVVSVYVTLLGDIILHLQGEEMLFSEMERLAVTLRCIGDGVITTDREGNIVLLNKVAEELTGWSQEDATGVAFEEVFNIIDFNTRQSCNNPVDRAIKSGLVEALNSRTILISKAGVEREIEDSGAPIYARDSTIIGVVLVFRDVTNQRRMEQELAKADKLESVGLLAGGIAHDFNNILTAIAGNVSLILAQPSGEVRLELLQGVEKATQRARDLTQQLLTFARGGAPVKKLVSLEELISETTRFALSGTNVRCEFEFPADLWAAEVDAAQVHQVINNLTLNAVQAMHQGGVIRVQAMNYVIDDKSPLPITPGNYLLVHFQDTGNGISPDILAKIFDPYFTTKESGSGLGLATVFSIMRQHGGAITVESEPGAGTTFNLYFPANDTDIPAPASVDRQLTTASGRILVMDDDEIVREVVVNMLERLGYHAIAVPDGAQAIDQYMAAKASENPFDLIIMDLTIPGGMGGKEAIAKLRVLDPAVKAIVSSGYSTDPIMAKYRRHGFVGVIAKPYKL
ncbi:MAG: PAS domain S-box protein, partial [bacterium]